MKVKLPNSPLAKSLVLHAIILACLFVSISFTADPLPMPATNAPVMQATFIDAQAMADRQREQDQAEAAERERQRQAEQKRKRERDAAAKAKREQEQKDREQKRQQELKRKAAEEARKKREREEAQKQEELRKQKEAKEQEELDRIMQQQIEEERAAQQQRRSRQVLSEVDKYETMIDETIKQNLYEDPSFKGKQCKLSIRLATTGLVTEVLILEGDSALCLASRNAVLRADKLPVSSDPDVFEQIKKINLTVKL